MGRQAFVTSNNGSLNTVGGFWGGYDMQVCEGCGHHFDVSWEGIRVNDKATIYAMVAIVITLVIN